MSLKVKAQIVKVIKATTGEKEIYIETPEIESHGDYSSNVAMVMFAKSGGKAKKVSRNTRDDKVDDEILSTLSKSTNPRELAEEIVKKLSKDIELKKYVSKIEVAGPGFINFWLTKKTLADELQSVLEKKDAYGQSNFFKNKKFMVEYAHPNTHKEMHIGHMRTLIVGESISRLLNFSGAKVFRANYQGDIGPHVAKAIWGTGELLSKKKMSWDEAEKLSFAEKAHLLGSGYVYANKVYDDKKSEIDVLNRKIYDKEPEAWTLYQKTRQWSLDYYDEFYKRFGTKFDRFYFESETAEEGKKIVLDNVGKVFEKSEGAVIFDGEKYGLHKRVFVTTDGNPTYEGKDMALAPLQYKEFEFDKVIHVVGSDQKGYFQVVIKALELLYDYMKGKQYHMPMGMVSLVGAKISSRTGVIIRVDELLSDIKKLIVPLVKNGNFEKKEAEKIAEMITIGAVKYSVLKTGTTSAVKFDIKQSVSLEGNSGPYLQYTYARTQSVLRKVKKLGVIASSSTSSRTKQSKNEVATSFCKAELPRDDINDEEMSLLRTFVKFQEVVENAAQSYAPNLICNYLYDLAQKFNKFYGMHKILTTADGLQTTNQFRLTLTAVTGQILKNGLQLLGIQTPEKM